MVEYEIYETKEGRKQMQTINERHIKRKSGISLIVLVITIIVMIILAAAVILSLTSSGIIGRANSAVDKTNLAQVQTLAQTIWSEIYLENLEGANLDYETEVPKRLGEQKIDTTKYNINADASGVTVTLKGSGEETPKLNKYGFYYNVPYVATDENNVQATVVFYSDNTLSMFRNDIFFATIPCEYSEGKVKIAGSDAVEFKDNGETFEISGMAMVATGKEHGVYYGYNYVDDAGNSVCFAENGSLMAVMENETSYDYNLFDWSAKGHVAQNRQNSDIKLYVSVDGKKIYINDVVYNLGGQVEREIDNLAAGLYESGALDLYQGFGKDVSDMLIASWDELIEFGYMTVTDGVLTHASASEALPVVPYVGFTECLLAGDLILPVDNSITEIGPRAFFHECVGLTGIMLPDSVTSIGDNAFNGAGLLNISIPDSVTYMADNAFVSCENVQSITVAKDNAVYHSTGNCLIETASKTLVVGCKNSVMPNDGSVTTISSYAFSYCTGLKEITIPDSVTSIGYGAFESCTSLTMVTFGKNSQLTSIDNMAFYACTSLTTVTFGGNSQLTSIGDSVFYRCTSLTSVDIPDGVTNIGMDAFSDCTSLTSVDIPDGVTNIGIQAFLDCTSLASITFEGTVSQWANITKGSNWNANVPATEVVCSDGTVNI